MLPPLFSDDDESNGRRTDPTRPVVRPPETSRPPGPARPKSGGKTLGERGPDRSGQSTGDDLGIDLLQEPATPFTNITQGVEKPNVPDMKRALGRVKRAHAGHFIVDSAPQAASSIDLTSDQEDVLARPPTFGREVQDVAEGLREHRVHIVNVGVGSQAPHVVTNDSGGCTPRVEDLFQFNRAAQAFLILLQKVTLKRACTFIDSMRKTHIAFPPVIAIVLHSGTEAADFDGIQHHTECLLRSGADAVIMQPPQRDYLPQLLASSLASVRAQRDLKKAAVEERSNQLFFQDVHILIPNFPKMNVSLPEMEPSRSKCGGVGRHVFLKKLGNGKYGQVFLFKDADGRYEVAKVIPKSNVRHARHAKQIFKECHLLRKVSSHPHIVTFTGFTHARRNLYIFMEFGGEMDVTSKMNKAPGGRLEGSIVHGLITQVADAVAYCHKKLVAHRDLKPDNIVVNSSGAAVLVDFGLAVCADELCEDKCGTVPYSPPEVYRGLAFEPKCMDVWGLGVVLLHMICGNHSLVKMMGYSQAPEPGERLAQALEGFFDPDDVLPWCTRVHQMHPGIEISVCFQTAMRHSIVVDPKGRCTARDFYQHIASRSWTERRNESASEVEPPPTSRRAPAALPPVECVSDAQSELSRFINEGVDSCRPTFS